MEPIIIDDPPQDPINDDGYHLDDDNLGADYPETDSCRDDQSGQIVDDLVDVETQLQDAGVDYTKLATDDADAVVIEKVVCWTQN